MNTSWVSKERFFSTSYKPVCPSALVKSAKAVTQRIDDYSGNSTSYFDSRKWIAQNQSSRHFKVKAINTIDSRWFVTISPLLNTLHKKQKLQSLTISLRFGGLSIFRQNLSSSTSEKWNFSSQILKTLFYTNVFGNIREEKVRGLIW